MRCRHLREAKVDPWRLRPLAEIVRTLQEVPGVFNYLTNGPQHPKSTEIAHGIGQRCFIKAEGSLVSVLFGKRGL
jgi:hypothetical protein